LLRQFQNYSTVSLLSLRQYGTICEREPVNWLQSLKEQDPFTSVKIVSFASGGDSLGDNVLSINIVFKGTQTHDGIVAVCTLVQGPSRYAATDCMSKAGRLTAAIPAEVPYQSLTRLLMTPYRMELQH